MSLAFGGLGLDIYLDGYYCRTRPNVAEPSKGRVVRDVVCHGTVVFLTREEYLAHKVVLPSFFILSFAVGALLYKWFKQASLKQSS